MADDDLDGVWSVTVEMDATTNNLMWAFVNSPNDKNDWGGKKEDLTGQDCAHGQWNDRKLDLTSETPGSSITKRFCFGSCEAGYCIQTTTEAPTTTDDYVTILFKVHSRVCRTPTAFLS